MSDTPRTDAAPKFIWLNDGEGRDPDSPLNDYEGVCWCEHPVDDNDTPYIRRDIYESELAAATARVAELERLMAVDADELARRREYMGTTLQEVFDRAESAAPAAPQSGWVSKAVDALKKRMDKNDSFNENTGLEAAVQELETLDKAAPGREG